MILANKFISKILIILMVFVMFGCAEPPVQVDFENLPIVETPNFYTVCPPDYCNYEPSEISPVFAVNVNKVVEAWKKVIEKQPRISILAEDNESYQYTYIQRSKLFRFPDTINVKFIPLENNHSTLAVYSQSKYGYSDMGVNKKRVDSWLDLLSSELETVR